MQTPNEEERARLWLNYAVEYNARAFKKIASAFPSLEEAFAAFIRHSADFSGWNERVQTRLAEAANPGFLDAFCERLSKKNIYFTYPGERNYPKLLGEIKDPPSVLYYIGRIEPDPELSIAIVGSRHPTKYGLEMAKRFGKELAGAGALIVSGMAEGVDAAAARGALDSATRDCATIAVLGCGVDVVYPRANEKLYDEIRERGAVVSEFLPGSRAERFHFPVRNRVMSGMAHGTLVIEAAERSGTSITVSCAHDQGREVFAVPGRIGDVMSVGPNGMIARGEAKPVFSTEDVLGEFACLHVPAEPRPEVVRIPASTLTEAQMRVCALLEQGEMSFDELCETLDMPVGALNSCLTELQFLGIMKQLPGRWYVLDTCQAVITEE
ncbi:MAG: DNA-processing protein DprA [Eubacteriales bacterium]|nr:DNA-processing protein DprA [Eubacteriales bacterium]